MAFSPVNASHRRFVHKRKATDCHTLSTINKVELSAHFGW
jgi:hypothetical protein